MPTETRLTSINLFKSQADYEANKHNLAEGDLVAVAIDLIPVGTIIAYAGSEPPSGYLPCNGSAISRETYADLFAVIGTTYGSGDGSTTFNLPNLNNNSFLEGSNIVGTVKSAGLPNITGEMQADRFGLTVPQVQGETIYQDGALYQGGNQRLSSNYLGSSYAGGTRPFDLMFDASRSNSIYGKSTTVQPKSVTVKFCIKY